jgi:hypothetical protein
MGILDAVPVLHTRPVGKLRDADLHRRMAEENDQILAAHDAPLQMVTFAGIGPDLQDLALDPDELLVQLVRGWDYLFAGNPQLLRWTVEHQAPFFDWPAYPVLGKPSSPPAWTGRDRP